MIDPYRSGATVRLKHPRLYNAKHISAQKLECRILPGALSPDGIDDVTPLQIPRHAGPRFHVMSGRYSTACRATVPRQAGPVRER